MPASSGRPNILTILVLATATSAGAPSLADEAPEASDDPVVFTVDPDATPERYQQEIGEIEAEYGAFHPELGEQLFGLGRAFEQTGRLSQAAGAYERALQIVRVNQGLHSAAQVDLVERLIVVHTRRGDMDRVHDLHHYKAWLARRNGELPASERISDLLEVARWHIETYRFDPETPPFQHLRAAEGHFEKVVDLATPITEQTEADVFRALDGIAITAFEMAQVARTGGNVRGSGVSSASLNASREVDDMEVRVRIMDTAYRTGRDALERGRELAATRSRLTFAARTILAGDWQLMFGRRFGARRLYKEAYAALGEAGFSDAEIDLMFDEPIPLPVSLDGIESGLGREAAGGGEGAGLDREGTMAALKQTAPGNEAAADGLPFVRTAFAVTRSGRARSVRVLDSDPPEDVSLRREALRRVRETPFRPRLVAGEPVRTDEVVWRLVFPGAAPPAGSGAEPTTEDS